VAFLYVTEQRSILRKTSDRIYLEKDHQTLLEIPCLKLDAVLLFGNVQVTTQALVELLDHGIELAFLSLSGKLHGQLTPPKARNLPLRMKQYERAHSTTFCLDLARELVRGKIANSVAVLRRFRRNHPDALAPEEIEEVAGALPALDRAASLRISGSGCSTRSSNASSRPARSTSSGRGWRGSSILPRTACGSTVSARTVSRRSKSSGGARSPRTLASTWFEIRCPCLR